jgi:hypothetical protein
MYDNLERRKRKIQQMKDEISKMYKIKKVFLFNVFNISKKEEFKKKMDKDFDYIEYKVLEEDAEENCLVIEVAKTMAEDFLNVDGCQINNANIEVYLDESLRDREPKKAVGLWDQPVKKKKPSDPKPKPKTKAKTGRKRLTNN